ncbi:MAG TPA: FAD-dependent oxidoreductase [Burkholderiales bacterium]|nr:FAD-dependent oxidoreductase [Burkholderiales bacterium]
MSYVLPVYEYRTPPEIREKKSFSYPVIVVGGGMAGLTAALELGARGVRTVLLDEDNTVGAQGLSSRGICYARRSLEILDRHGIAERIRAKGVTWNEGEVYRGAERLYRFNLRSDPNQRFPAFVNLQQFYVEQYMVERLQQMPSVDLRWKNKVLQVKDAGDSVRVQVETPEGRYEATCAYLLACDGAHGVVRAQLGAQDAESELLESVWCIADVRMAGETDVVRKSYLDSPLNEGGAIWYHQMADGIWRTDWLITHYPDRDAEATPERAAARLRKLLGPERPFELVWVGAYRFRKRYLKRMRVGRSFFLGDAAAQHSPFGARGGNRAIQDAHNLAWKLAFVLQGRAHADLLETYHEERHPAAIENVEHSTRSAVFIGPEKPGQRLLRDAILDLAQRHTWARDWVNTGRLSVASVYEGSPLNRERGEFPPDAPKPGASVEGRGGDDFEIVQQDGATYVFRPDGHVLARCAGDDPAFARAAIDDALSGKRIPPVSKPARPNPDRFFDELAARLDATPAPERERVLARLVVTLADRLGIEAAREALRSL